jgi:SAM-dependent methyltransferase
LARGTSSQVIASYEIIGERHASRALDSVYNDYYERPVMHSLLGKVSGQRVLDAGCGPGSYAEWLVEHGATVLALDASPKMVQLAKQRLQGKAEVRQADLNEPLDFIEEDTYDAVLCALVLDYIRDWERLFADFHRILVAGGRMVFSVHHPFFLDLKVEAGIEDNYFSTQQVEEDWLAFGLTIPAYRRPLGVMSSALWETGFMIERIVEPEPIEACKDVYPQHYVQLSRHPVFLCVSARKKE